MTELEKEEATKKETIDKKRREQFRIYEQEFEKQLLEKEKWAREKSLRTSFMSSLAVTITLMTTSMAVYTYYLQDKKEQEIESVLARQVSFSTQELQLASLKAEAKIESLIQELNAQKEAISSINVSDDKSNLSQQLTKDIASISVRVANAESELRALEQAKLPSKLALIEESIQGSTEQLLSVPLIRNDFKNYKQITDREFLRLEKGIEKLESRLNFFVTTTVTLSLGIFAAVAAPIVSSYSKRRKDSNVE
ncbi:hypothetical protein NTE03_003766 [Vibrio mimicus]